MITSQLSITFFINIRFFLITKTFDIPFTILKKCINAQIKETKNMKINKKKSNNKNKKLNSDLFEEF